MKKICFPVLILILFLSVKCGECYPDGYCKQRDKYEKYESELIDFKGNKISHSEYLKFEKMLRKSTHFRDYNIDRVRIFYVYLINKNKKTIKYFGKCLYYSYVFVKEVTRFDAALVFSEYEGTSTKWIKTDKIIFYMVKFDPFRWHEVIVSKEFIYLITEEYMGSLIEK